MKIKMRTVIDFCNNHILSDDIVGVLLNLSCKCFSDVDKVLSGLIEVEPP